MKAIFSYDDEHTGMNYIVIPKIREIHKALGNVVITFDNGDRRTLDVSDVNGAMSEIITSIEEYYNR